MGNQRRFSRIGRVLALGYLGLVALTGLAAYVLIYATDSWTVIVLAYWATLPTSYMLERLRWLERLGEWLGMEGILFGLGLSALAQAALLYLVGTGVSRFMEWLVWGSAGAPRANGGREGPE
jgi:hypothetical protein